MARRRTVLPPHRIRKRERDLENPGGNWGEGEEPPSRKIENMHRDMADGWKRGEWDKDRWGSPEMKRPKHDITGSKKQKHKPYITSRNYVARTHKIDPFHNRDTGYNAPDQF